MLVSVNYQLKGSIMVNQSNRSSVPQPQQARPPVRPPVQAPPPPAGSQAFNSLFVPAAEVKTLLKVLFFGAPGSGKTPLALSFPRPAVIDVEGLAKVYARSFPNARFFPANDWLAVKAGIQAVIADGGASCDTLVIDSLTPIYDERKAYYLQKFGYLDQPQWSRINTEMKTIYALLAVCPVHTVVIGREAVLYEETPGQGKERAQLKAVGTRMDLDKAAGYQPNILIHVTGNKAGIVEKVQGVEMAKGTEVPDLTWGAFFEPIAKSLATGDDPQDITTGVGKALFLAFWNGRGLKNSQIAEALGVKSSNDWKTGRAAADERIEAAALKAGWLKSEDEPASASDSNAPRMNPMGGQSPRLDKFIQTLADGLVPLSFKTVERMEQTYTALVDSGEIPPDWESVQIIDYMVDYALRNSE